MMRLVVDQVISDREIVHFANSDELITSAHHRVYVKDARAEIEICLPNPSWKTLLGASRLVRRAMRWDKCNVVPVGQDTVIVRQEAVYHYERSTARLTEALRLRQCRNVLHQSILVLDDQNIYFGEYGRNSERRSVPIHCSNDGGKNWHVIYEFPDKKTKHIHGCYWDPYEEKLWVVTGDFRDECHVLVTDRNFETMEWIGNGQQMYRTCNLFFEPDAVHWMMDCPLEDSYHVRFDRNTREATLHTRFPGPVWYIKRLTDGYFLAATTQEVGPGVRDKFAHLMVSKDLQTWQSIHQFEHDGWPKRYFKFGVIGFADGEQSSDCFYIFGEALKDFDGKCYQCHLTE